MPGESAEAAVRLSARARALSPSPTLALDALAKEMRSRGRDVISLAAGEPDFPTPEEICRKGMEAIREGYTRYTPTAGLPALREAICRRLQLDRGLSYQPDQVVVTVGAKQALYNAFQVLLDPGDEVILPSPYWVSYVEQIRLAGGVPVLVPTAEEEGFVVNPAAVAERITPRTRALLLNSPCNPTGAVYPPELLLALGRLAVEHDLILISDEIYARLIYGGVRYASPAALDEEVKERTLVIDGVSKTYAMTGWRIGYAVGNRAVIRAMVDLQSHSTSNATAVAQVAAIEALNGDQEAAEKMRREFQRRRDYILERLRGLPGVTCHRPEGAFYAFPGVRELLGGVSRGGRRIEDVEALCTALLEEGGVAVVPGTAFGSPNHLRLSYATALDQLEKAMGRLAHFITGLRK